MTKKSKAKKSGGWKKVLLGFIVAIVLIILVALFATSGLPKEANTFFDELKDNNIEAAYTRTANQFQTQTSLKDFNMFIEQLHLKNVEKTKRNNREIENNQGKLEGTITLEGDTQIPLIIKFIKEDDSRKIYSMYVPDGGLTQDVPANNNEENVPAIEDLVAESMEMFASAVNKKDFTEFHSYISTLRQKQITAEELKKTFAAFIDNEINLSGISQQKLTLNQPKIQDNGVVSVQGAYPYGEDLYVNFALSYIEEANTRKLVGIEVYIQ